MAKGLTPLVLGSLLLAVLFYQNCAPQPLEPSTRSKDSSIEAASVSSTEANPVLGYIDGFVQESSGTTLKGWACAKGINTPITIRVYRGGPATIGDEIGVYPTGLPNGSAVATACGNSGTNHRFSIPIKEDLKQLHVGQLLYIHGVSPNGGKDKLLTRSGEITIPTAGTSTSLDVSRVPIYRFLKPSGAYFFTLSYEEGANPVLKFVPQGTIDLYKSDRSGVRAPVYRCLIPNTDVHFMSRDPSCERQSFEGLLGYVEQNQQAWATRALYRCWKSTGHLITVNAAECQNNQFTVEGALGYVP